MINYIKFWLSKALSELLLAFIIIIGLLLFIIIKALIQNKSKEETK